MVAKEEKETSAQGQGQTSEMSSSTAVGDTAHHDFGAPLSRSHTVPTSSLNVPADVDNNAAATAMPRRSSRPQQASSTDKGASFRGRAESRVGTFLPVDDFDEVAMDFESSRPGWQPGSEPGIDPSKPDGGHASVRGVQAPCDITVADFNEFRVEHRKFTNETFIEFLAQPQPAWSKCRWINVNGLSWDVIQACGQHKNLHKLAVEDVLNTRNRTKTDWYLNHAFIVLTLQKLVRLVDPDSSSDSSDSESDDDDDSPSEADSSSFRSKHGFGLWPRKAKRWFSGRRRRGQPSSPGSARSAPAAPSRRNRNNNRSRSRSRASMGATAKVDLERSVPPLPTRMPMPMPVPARIVEEDHQSGSERLFSSVGAALGLRPSRHRRQPEDAILVRTLQRYHASPNEARTEYMERHSSLTSRDLAVSAEQVSIFLTSDNTVISFFELSAGDIEKPIAVRLSTPGTILRQECDASLLVQAIIDAIIDLALPVTAVYTDVLGDLELDVLTSPDIKQSKSLYICISEINKMRSFLNPIDNVVNMLRDHTTDLPPDEAARELRNPESGVIVTPLTHTYLGDVLDHCVLINEAMEQSKASAYNLVDLIFNTISARQNETMRQLTAITVIFLPLTFLTGYFGQNFEPFPDLEKEGIEYFWKIAGPVVFFTVVIMMWSGITSWLSTFFQRRHNVALRKRRKRKRKTKAKEA